MKELIPWSDAYKLGVEEIDAQHQKMIGIINKLYSAMVAATEKEELGVILKEMTDYADYHFSTEEKYFDQFDYVDKEEHKKSHEAYRAKITKFSEEYYNNAVMLPFEMMDFLGEWWTGHILGSDKEYVECFHAHGLK